MTELWAFDDGTLLERVHPAEQCIGRGCPLHHPSDHHMATWPLFWSNARGQMFRKCEHGIPHPDPDDVAYKLSRIPVLMGDMAMLLQLHTCPCACCDLT